jgi:eukaryotic-like serine/threonine-protein kinase
MKLPARLGRYEILSLLGSGGMGEVYRARDQRLGREVALKVLPAELASHPERLERLEREARAASALNHPNIVVLHDVGREDGVAYLVMELVEGETLAERLARGPLPLSQVLLLGAQIGSALDACHMKGLVHRDLKPGNIMLTPAGAKLLDFGLARALETDPTAASRSSTAPTAASPLTREGVVLGTLPYMAPEQLQGGPVDARCDVFALGAVLFEATTGRRAFVGDTSTAIARAILSSDPPPASSLVPECPRALDRVIQLCLEKDPERRLGSARDLGLQLSSLTDGAAASPAPEPRRSRSMYWLSAALAVLSVALLSLVVRDGSRGRPSVEGVVRFQFLPPPGGSFLSHVEGPVMAVSPDGSRVAFIATDAASPHRIWLRAVDDLELRPLVGTEGALSLFWSRDGRSIGFFAGGQLKRVDPSGTSPVTITSLARGVGRIGTWGTREILFSSIQGDAIYRVSPDGGEPSVVLEPDSSRGEARANWPWFLPDGESFLYCLKMDDGRIQLMFAKPGETPIAVGAISSQAQYVEPGFLVYARDGGLLAQRFDLHQGRLEGSPLPLAPAVRSFQSNGWAAFATSPSGTLAYQSEPDVMRLRWYDRGGNDLGTVGSPGTYLSVAISPDGKRALFDRTREGLGTWDVWSLDLERGTETRVTSSPDTEAEPRWLPDGKSIVYFAVEGGLAQITRRALANERNERLVPRPAFQTPMDVSPDGRTLLFQERDQKGTTLWTLSLDPKDGGERSAAPLPISAVGAESVRFSPDGRWLAFLSNESDRYEAYVTSFDGRAEKLRVSSEGARVVRWGRSTGELLYLSLDGGLYSVAVAGGSELRLGKAELLFRLPPQSRWNRFEVMQNGERFLAIVTESSGNERPANVVLHWPALASP